MPLFSIITVSWNAGDLLFETMRSIADQDFEDCEWIVKDAGSDDHSLDPLCGFRRYPVQIITKPDRGIYDAMNQALKHASGEFIHFLNAGDTYSDSSALSRVAATLSCIRPPPAVAYTYYNDLLAHSVVTYPEHLRRFFLYRTNVCHQAQFIHARIAKACGDYDASYKLCADREFMLRLLQQDDASSLRIPFPAVNYRGGGLSARTENLVIRTAEHRRIDLQYFSSQERFLYDAVKFLTLAPWRARLAESSSDGIVKNSYNKLRSLIKRWV